MDTYNATYHADVDQSLELNENMPINYNAQNYMTNDARENSVESINIDNADGKKSDYYNDQIGHPQYAIQEESYILIWKYIEQIKSISAGLPPQLIKINAFLFITLKLLVKAETVKHFSTLFRRLFIIILRWITYCMGHLSSIVL